MKISVTLIMGGLALLYSTGCVLWAESGRSIPDAFLYPIVPGIWVGARVYENVTHMMPVCYAAGIATMMLLGGLFGAVFDLLCGRRGASGD